MISILHARLCSVTLRKRDGTDVRLGASAGEIERLHGEWLVWMCCDATDVRLERLPAEWSVHMGNGWF